MGKVAFLDFVVEIVRRIDHGPGLKLLPRRFRGLLTAVSSGNGLSVC
jgi:hypothetical protein